MNSKRTSGGKGQPIKIEVPTSVVSMRQASSRYLAHKHHIATISLVSVARAVAAVIAVSGTIAGAVTSAVAVSTVIAITVSAAVTRAVTGAVAAVSLAAVVVASSSAAVVLEVIEAACVSTLAGAASPVIAHHATRTSAVATSSAAARSLTVRELHLEASSVNLVSIEGTHSIGGITSIIHRHEGESLRATSVGSNGQTNFGNTTVLGKKIFKLSLRRLLGRIPDQQGKQIGIIVGKGKKSRQREVSR